MALFLSIIAQFATKAAKEISYFRKSAELGKGTGRHIPIIHTTLPVELGGFQVTKASCLSKVIHHHIEKEKKRREKEA